MHFLDRHDAGLRLVGPVTAAVGGPIGGRPTDPVVLGVGRGGLPVARPLAEALGVSFDVVPVRRLPLPFQRAVSLGAVGEGGVLALRRSTAHTAGLRSAEVAAVMRRERAALRAFERHVRAARPAAALTGRTVVLVDDGAVSGCTARAAVAAARARGAARVVLALPICQATLPPELEGLADGLVTLERPWPTFPIGAGYARFDAVTDEDALDLLLGRTASGRPGPDMDPVAEVGFQAGCTRVLGDLVVPATAVGVVVVAGASTVERFDPRRRRIARLLRAAGFATLVVDLLVGREGRVRSCVEDVDLLARRLGRVVDDLCAREVCRGLRVGVLAVGTVGAAALATTTGVLGTVPLLLQDADRLTGHLPRRPGPARAVVGDGDPALVEGNRRAAEDLGMRLDVVPGAVDPLEGGACPRLVLGVAEAWFGEHLGGLRSDPEVPGVGAGGAPVRLGR